jgi:hypothetical protein
MQTLVASTMQSWQTSVVCSESVDVGAEKSVDVGAENSNSVKELHRSHIGCGTNMKTMLCMPPSPSRCPARRVAHLVHAGEGATHAGLRHRTQCCDDAIGQQQLLHLWPANLEPSAVLDAMSAACMLDYRPRARALDMLGCQ